MFVIKAAICAVIIMTGPINKKACLSPANYTTQQASFIGESPLHHFQETHSSFNLSQAVHTGVQWGGRYLMAGGWQWSSPRPDAGGTGQGRTWGRVVGGRGVRGQGVGAEPCSGKMVSGLFFHALLLYVFPWEGGFYELNCVSPKFILRSSNTQYLRM